MPEGPKLKGALPVPETICGILCGAIFLLKFCALQHIYISMVCNLFRRGGSYIEE